MDRVDDRLADLPPDAFAKADGSDDDMFYVPARLVTHIDDQAIAALTVFYRTLLRPRDAVLDLMSSWVSHLPDDFAAGDIVGHGMNADELAANPRLTRWFVQNLNRHAQLPLADMSFDAALCCVGVQYLQQPAMVFADVARVLRPGSPLVVSFSNRCFASKAVALWLALDMPGRARLVALYLERAGFDEIVTHVLADGGESDPLVAVVGRRRQ